MKSMLCLALLLAAPAHAEWHLSAEALTDVPIQVGGRVELRMPMRFQISTSLGVMPGAYVDLINETALAFDWYNEATATLVEIVAESSIVSRTHLGWQPFADYGFYVEVGYGFVGAGGDTAGSELLAEASGAEPPSGRGEQQFDASATLHMIDVEFGWRWNLWEGLWLRAGLGGAFTVASDSTVTASSDAPVWRAFEDATERYLISVFESYGHTAVGTVGVSYMFF